MKTTFKAKVVVETKRYISCHSPDWTTNGILTMEKIREEIEKGHYKLEFIAGDLGTNNEPTLIIKI